MQFLLLKQFNNSKFDNKKKKVIKTFKFFFLKKVIFFVEIFKSIIMETVTCNINYKTFN